MLLDIVPQNIVSPFQEGNALQIIFMGVCLGIALLILGDKASGVTDIVDQLNGVICFLMSGIGRLVPLFVMLSVFSMISSDSFSEIGGAVKCIPLTVAGTFICAFLFALAVSVKLKVSLGLVMKKLLPPFILGLSTASSAFGVYDEICETKLGISKKIGNFAIPLGKVIFMPGTAIAFVVTSLCMAENGGVSITLPWLIIMILVCSLLSMAAPPIPGGTMTCYTIIFTQLGIPMELLPLTIAVNLLLEFPMTAVNISCLQSELILIAAKLGMLDEETMRNTDF